MTGQHQQIDDLDMPLFIQLIDPAIRYEEIRGKQGPEGTALRAWRVTRAMCIKQTGWPAEIVWVPVTRSAGSRG